jgi:hypothetical protein
MARRRLRLGGLGLVGGLLASVLGGGAAAQDTLCDPAVPLREDVNYGYQERGDRCEGIYANSPVSGSTIGVASFTKGTVSYEFTTIPLEITWPSGLDQPVRLRAKPLRPDLFYQMDTFQPATASSFVWPTDFLLQYQIKPQDLAILGWSMVPVGGQDLRVYLPLGIHQGDATPQGGGYNLLAVPGVDLAELFISIDLLDQGGRPERRVLERTALGFGFYPADSGVPIELPDLAGPGIYKVKLIAKLLNGIERPEDFWFYHPTD